MPFFVVNDKTKIYYEETGKDHKETVMILHGLGSSHLKKKILLINLNQIIMLFIMIIEVIVLLKCQSFI